MCGLFILWNIAMESEHNTKLFYKNVLNKSVYNNKDVLCLLFFKDERYVEKQIVSLIFHG